MTLPSFLLFANDAPPPADTRAREPRGPRGVRPVTHAATYDEAALLRQMAGDGGVAAETALEEIFRAWYAPLVTFARVLLGEDADAQDVVQEVFIDLWRRRTTLSLSTTVAAYLHSAVRHRALTRRRDAANRQRLLGTIAGAELADTPGTDDALTAEDARDERRFRAVITAADGLPPRAREVFYLRWRQGLSYKEIAAVMAISVKTVEAQMTIAMRRVREAVRGL